MAFRILCSLSLTAFVITYASAKQYNLTRHGYGYDTFNKVEDLAHMIKDPNVMFEMHIAIQGEREGRVLLSPVLKPKDNDTVYEIVFGAGNNTYNDLRRNTYNQLVVHRLKSSVVSADISNILSTTELRSFYIKIYKDGHIIIGKEGDKPVISYVDETLLRTKYFSFGAYFDVSVVFVYDFSETSRITSTVLPEPVPVTTPNTIEGDLTEVNTTVDMIYEFTTIKELITTDKPEDSQTTIINASKNEIKDEHPHIMASMTIEKSGTVSTALGPLTWKEASLLLKLLLGGYVPSDSHVNNVSSNDGPRYDTYIQKDI